MDTNYTKERNIQILISLLKAHNIKKVVVSPGTTNITFVASIQCDPYFEIFSSVDERSAAYIACGMASESGEPVVLSCTGATASRNYLPGLTEAFYRKLPILAVTSTQHIGRVGQNIAQVIDRSVMPNDVVKLSVQVSEIHSDEDEWAANVAINRALIALRSDGGGPAHINLTTTYSRDYSVIELPEERVIRHISYGDKLPALKKGKVAIYVGSHAAWSEKLTEAVDKFCEIYDGVVLCDHTSNYNGKYGIHASLLSSQDGYIPSCRHCDTLIHIGQVSGAEMTPIAKCVWRVSPDGIVRDTFKKLQYIFEMEELDFFLQYTNINDSEDIETEYYINWRNENDKIKSKIPENLPFSNAWIAKQTAHLLPKGSVLHLGILNSLRNWNFFEVDKSILGYSNTGGFGIDGDLSSLIGASLASSDKLFFGVVGDLAFFYDMNSLGNRYIGNNIRILLINNGRGVEFRNYNHPAARFGKDADAYMAAAGHFGNKSRDLVRHYASDLGFEYMSANNKEEYLKQMDRFLTPEITASPMLMEVFTNEKDESDALKMMRNIETSATSAAKNMIKGALGDEGVKKVKKLLGR